MAEFNDKPATYADMNRIKEEIIGRIDQVEKTLLSEMYKEFDVVNKVLRRVKK